MKYEIGQKIKWLTIFNGKITSVTGTIISVGEKILRCEGHTVMGVFLRDWVATDDNSISIL